MDTKQIWYGAGLLLMVLALIEVAFLSYENHNTYGILVGTWGVACLVMGLRSELTKTP